MNKYTTRHKEKIYYTIPLPLCEKMQRTKEFVNTRIKEKML